MALTLDQLTGAIKTLPWNQGTSSPTTSTPTLSSLTAPAPTTTAVPQVSNPVTSTTTPDYSKSPYAKYFQNTPAPLMGPYQGDEGGMYATIAQNNIDRN